MDVGGCDVVIIVGGVDIVAGGSGCIIVMPPGNDEGGGCACASGDGAGGTGCDGATGWWWWCCGLPKKARVRKEKEQETVSRWACALTARQQRPTFCIVAYRRWPWYRLYWLCKVIAVQYAYIGYERIAEAEDRNGVRRRGAGVGVGGAHKPRTRTIIKQQDLRRGRRGGGLGRSRGLQRAVEQLRGRLGWVGRRSSRRVGAGLGAEDVVFFGDRGRSLDFFHGVGTSING